MASSVKKENETFRGKLEPVAMEGVKEGAETMETTEQIELEDGELNDDDNIAPLAEVESTLFDGGEKKDDATKRFSLFGDLTLALPKEELQELYDSLCINEENERHYRFNTVHLRGTDKMKSDDVFEYFGGLEPAHVDWLADGVCNVQWEDEILPARALLYLSVKINNTNKRTKIENRRTNWSDSDNESDVDEPEVEVTGNVVDAATLKFPLPPGHWRKGQSCDKSKRIIMRYANKDDKVVSGQVGDRYASRHHSHRHGKRTKHKEIHVEDGQNNPWGGLAQTWGRGEGTEKQIYNTAQPRNLHDLRASLNDISESRFADIYLRRAAELHRQRPPSPPIFLNSSTESDSSDDDFKRRRKLPKMRADIEEERLKRARLEQAVRTSDLRSRINHKIVKTAAKPIVRVTRTKQNDEQSEESGDDLNWAQEGYSDLKMTLDNRSKMRDRESSESDSDDLGLEEPGEMLQIEVDNEYYKERRRRH